MAVSRPMMAMVPHASDPRRASSGDPERFVRISSGRRRGVGNGVARDELRRLPDEAARHAGTREAPLRHGALELAPVDGRTSGTACGTRRTRDSRGGTRAARATGRADSSRAACGEPCRPRRRAAPARPACSTRPAEGRRCRRASTESGSSSRSASANDDTVARRPLHARARPRGPRTRARAPRCGRRPLRAARGRLHLPDPAADLDDGPAVEAALLRPRGDLHGVGAAEPVVEVAPQIAARRLLVEDVQPVGAAGARHRPIVPEAKLPVRVSGPGEGLA